MLTGRNEWIAIAALIAWIAFVPCPYAMKQFFASPIGKVIALGAVIYAWKYVSMPVAVLLLVAFLRSGAIREYLDETGMAPPSTESVPSGSTNDFRCPNEFTYVADKMMCMKGTESKTPECNDPSMMWDSMVAKCVSKPATSSGGPAGGTTPGSAQAQNDMTTATTSGEMAVEKFTPYGGKKEDKFAPL